MAAETTPVQILERGRYLGETLRMRSAGGVLLTLVSYPPDLSFPAHAHEHPGFFLLLSGQHRETNSAGVNDQPPGTAIFHEAGDGHSTQVGPAGMVGLNISIDRGRLECPSRRPYVSVDAGGDVHVRYFALRLLSLVSKPETSDEDVETVTSDLLASISVGEEPGIPKWLTAGRECIEERFSERISLRTLAAEAGVHPNYFARSFRRHFGHSVSDYLHRVRLTEAISQVQTGRSIGEAAVESGFSDQAHLARLCRRGFNVSPGEMRRVLKVPIVQE